MDHRTVLLVAALRRQPQATALELAKGIGVSQPTLSRLLRALGDSVVTVGRARRARYALLRSVRGLPAILPVYRVGPSGQPSLVTTLAAIDPEGTYLADAAAPGWPLDEALREGVFPGLPYFVYDMRPQGFLGRAFARAQASRLTLPPDPGHWSDDDVLVALALAGDDMPGDLIVGAPALEAFQRSRGAEISAVSLPARETVYPERTAAALLGEAPGSSAGGEFAKFTAALDTPAGVQHVIVKFSPADDSAASVRWRDLLIAEQHAPKALSALGVAAAVSSVLICARRVFLEVPRFDRLGAHGRRAVVTLAAIEPALLGSGEARWEAGAAGLHRHGWLTDEDLARVRLLGLFGDCIGNTDMHPGNLAFLQSSPGALALAPAYDMLPMGFAPNRTGEIVARSLPVRPPAPGMEAPWRQALGAALGYWSRLSDDDRISEDFQRVCHASKQQLQALGDRFG